MLSYTCIIVVLGSNAVVSYILLGVNPPGQMAFTVNSSTGVITKDFDLDREAVDEYMLTIQVYHHHTYFKLSICVSVCQ